MKKTICVSNNNPKPYKCIIFMAGLFVTLDICCLFANEIISLYFGYTFLVTIISALNFMLVDIIAEVYGYKMSMILFLYSSLSKLLITLFLFSIIHLTSTTNDNGLQAYSIVLYLSFARCLIVFFDSLVAVHINSYLISKWKILFRGKYFWLRSVGSSAIGEIMFVLLPEPIFALIKHHHYSMLTLIFLISACSYRIIFTAISAFPSTIVVAILKKIENVDVHAPMQNYNPFLSKKISP